MLALLFLCVLYIWPEPQAGGITDERLTRPSMVSALQVAWM